MQLACPKCATRDVRVSATRSVFETLKSLVGIYQLRCRRCKERWQTSTWSDGAWKYAKCPRCYRQELTHWNEHYYHPPSSVFMMLRVGATPFRCPACRCNFASFRARRERFEWRHEPLTLPQNAPATMGGADLHALAHAVGDSTAPAQQEPVRN
jgi:hypothetical protein